MSTTPTTSAAGKVRDFSKRGDAIPIPDLTLIQSEGYERFLQLGQGPHERDLSVGLEALLREVFPIVSYDETTRLEYLHYTLEEPRYTPDECRELRLTYGRPFRVAVRLLRANHADTPEEEIYLGEFPIMMGGGEFIVNGAERVIVSQLHRSPGVDFSIVSSEGDRPLHSARIIPERGSWIELEVTKKDVLAMRIDQSTKLAATSFLRCLYYIEEKDRVLREQKFDAAPAEDKKKIQEKAELAGARVAATDSIIGIFYEVTEIPADQVLPEHWAAESVVDKETGEELVHVGRQIGDAAAAIVNSNLKKVRVVQNPSDVLILNTIAEEKLEQFPGDSEGKQALLKLYSKLRPGNPPQVDKAEALFREKFFDENRYRLGRVGRFRINRKFEMGTPEDLMCIVSTDFLQVVRYLLDLRSNRLDPKTNRPAAQVDDIDHLGNRRLRTLDELAVEELRKGFLKLKRTVQERMSVKGPDELTKIADLVNSKSISSAIDFFFGRSELSQVVDQTNPLSSLVHERRLSALGPGGLNRKRAGFEVRDVHISHYGRICPIETPEGTNIGLIASLGIYSSIDEYGFLRTPYREVRNGSITGKVVHLRADEEMKAVLAPTDSLDESGKLSKGVVLARVDGELASSPSDKVDYVDISPKQIVGISASLIPFLEHDDANRALMGSNMQRQAVPLIKIEPPCIATGVEKAVGHNSGMVIRAKNPGVITSVDGQRIIIDNSDEYVLRKFVGLNERTCLNQRPIVRMGQKVEKGQVIADGASTRLGELAIGKNILVAFNTFDGYNFEDAIVINERLVRDDVFTSIHIDTFDVEVRETKLGREEFTRDIPNVSEKMLRNLDEHGIIRIGARVGPGDILVGKVSPKSKTELTPEEKLLHAIFGRAGEDVKNDSLEVPAGVEGVVIGARKFSRRLHMNEEQKKQLKKDIAQYEAEMDDKAISLFRQMCNAVNEAVGTPMVDPNTRQRVGASDIREVILEQIKTFDIKWAKGSKEAKIQAELLHSQFWPRVRAIETEKQRKVAHMKRGDELPTGVLEMVKVYLATKRQLSVGDKMAGRHGNKGVIARIVPEEEMPFMEDGTPVDVLLNPLGVPSRMNVGQILETHLGWAARVLGFQAVTPVFDGAKEDEVHAAVDEANRHVAEKLAHYEKTGTWPHPRELLARMPRGGKIQLFDGRTGEPFRQRTTAGFMYLLKLHHLVDDKIHARATGPYSLITQQPLGGKARTGGQRFGEMEVWALEAYGAAYILQELLTVKSDDVEGRTKIYESMVKGNNKLEAGMPVAFDVLCNELKGLGMNITLEKKKAEGGSLL
ncbi:MAG: DNA-directed RNA polymerase subunit beta [Phycisphaeraceae bacterium]|nr:DNA-directed RNA polymerase subunit beta [Phycisphaerae bacterium]MBX3392854.1 DNA-directed RNA polymerase subunit beta [Phycisphaeraceae bacterium]